MSTLSSISQRIVVINLPYKLERRSALTRNLGQTGMARPDDITWAKALSGDWAAAAVVGRGEWGVGVSDEPCAGGAGCGGAAVSAGG